MNILFWKNFWVRSLLNAMQIAVVIGQKIHQMATESFKWHHSVNMKVPRRDKKNTHFLCVLCVCSVSIRRSVCIKYNVKRKWISGVWSQMLLATGLCYQWQFRWFRWCSFITKSRIQTPAMNQMCYKHHLRWCVCCSLCCRSFNLPWKGG